MKAKIYTLYGFGVALGVTGALCGIFASGMMGWSRWIWDSIDVLMIVAGLVFCGFGEKLVNKQDGEDKKNGR